MTLAALSDLASAASRLLGRVLPGVRRDGATVVSEGAARPVIAADQRNISAEASSRLAARSAAPVGSVVHFDVGAAEQTLEGAGRLSAKLDGLGWQKNGASVALDNGGTFLHYAVAGEENLGAAHWHDVPLQYLHDNTKGFLLRDVAPGTPIKAAPHVIVDSSPDHFYSINAKTPDDASAWLTAPNESFGWTTQANP